MLLAFAWFGIEKNDSGSHYFLLKYFLLLIRISLILTQEQEFALTQQSMVE